MIVFAILSYFMFGEAAQKTQATSVETRMASYEKRKAMEDATLLGALEFRNAGPREMGGRVVDVQGFEDFPNTFFAAYASGGLWKTVDNGIVWKPMFQKGPSITIGDFAVNPKNLNEIWVGSGEDNSSRSSYAGTGIYYSSDGGETWTNKGLLDTHHISEILIHPKDSQTVLVSAIGHLYSTNEERGVFKTTDGGETWKKVLYINDNTGVIDMVADPSNPDYIYAAAWERSRTAWNFVEGGKGSGIYISKDGGETWSLSVKGLPAGENMGRIGLAVSPANPKVIYASVDNQNEKTDDEKEPETDPLTTKKLIGMDKETFLANEDDDIKSFLRSNRFHKDITVKSIKADLESDKISMDDIRAYLYDTNGLAGSDVKGVEVYRSDNRGKTWKKMHDKPIPYLAFSYGYYFGIIKADPQDEDTIYVLGVPLIKSEDKGKTFKTASSPNVHGDHQAMWINPSNPKQILAGNDGGISMSYDGGVNWKNYNDQPVGQFYTVAYDMATPYRIYGGLQDNGAWRGPNREQDQYGQRWEFLTGGDGAFVQVDPRDNETIYSGLQFGVYFRNNNKTGDSQPIYPRHKMKEAPYRYNWMTPIVLSQHHNDVLYMASQRVLRSLDQGRTWEAISDDLSSNPSNIGDVPYATVSMLRESPHAFGTLYAGTDDGKLWITRGAEWENISITPEKELWVSGIEVSPHAESEVFVTLTGYRNDDFSSYVYWSGDYGKTWKDLTANLPPEPCNVIRQDPKNENILYLGTDLGLMISFDKGEHWQPHQAGLPNVPVYAMEIHPREHDLIAATHGRSVFVLNLDIMSQIEQDTFEKDLVVFDHDDPKFQKFWGSKGWPWMFGERKPPHSKIYFSTKDAVEAKITISKDDKPVYKQTLEKEKGVRVFKWDYRITEKKALKDEEAKWHDGQDEHKYATAGTYQVKLEAGDKTETIEFKIK